MVKKERVEKVGSSLMRPNPFSEVTFAVEDSTCPLFVDNTKTTYRLSHKAGLKWYITDQCLLRMCESETAVFSFESTPGETHTLTITLLSFTQATEVLEMTVVEQHSLAMELKTLGTELFRAKEFSLAAEKYGTALKVLISDGCRAGVQDAHVEKVQSVRSNLALCFQKIRSPDGILHHCNTLLTDTKHPLVDATLLVKVLYRRAWAWCEINEFEKCRGDLEAVLKLDGGNCEALKLRTVMEGKVKDNNREMSSKLRGLFRSS